MFTQSFTPLGYTRSLKLLGLCPFVFTLYTSQDSVSLLVDVIRVKDVQVMANLALLPPTASVALMAVAEQAKRSGLATKLKDGVTLSVYRESRRTTVAAENTVSA